MHGVMGKPPAAAKDNPGKATSRITLLLLVEPVSQNFVWDLGLRGGSWIVYGLLDCVGPLDCVGRALGVGLGAPGDVVAA